MFLQVSVFKCNYFSSWGSVCGPEKSRKSVSLEQQTHCKETDGCFLCLKNISKEIIVVRQQVKQLPIRPDMSGGIKNK